MTKYFNRNKYFLRLFLILIDMIVYETDQPEHEDEGGEKDRIESLEELRTELDLPPGVTFPPRPGHSFLVFLYLLLTVFSTLIGRGQARLGSHWARASKCCLRQQSYATKNKLVASKAP